MELTLPKVGDLELSGTPESLKFDSKGQNTLPWGVLGVIGKVLKCRCPKWPRIGHLDICSSSYGQKSLSVSAAERHKEYYREDQRGTKNTIGRMVVAPPESGPWCVM
jgi:hypothetical protein